MEHEPSEDSLAWAVFHREFNWSRPKSKYSFNAKPSPEPQSRVHDFVDAAVAAGAATRIEPPTAETTPKRKRRH
jgi:hypothetical protein